MYTKVQLDRLHNKDVLHRKWLWPCRSRDIYRFKGLAAVLLAAVTITDSTT